MAGRRRSPEIIAGRVNADGTIAAGDGFTVVRTGTGAYTVTIAVPGFRLVSVVLSTYTLATGVYGGGIPGERVFTVTTIATQTATLTDGTFGFIAAGVQT